MNRVACGPPHWTSAPSRSTAVPGIAPGVAARREGGHDLLALAQHHGVDARACCSVARGRRRAVRADRDGQAAAAPEASSISRGTRSSGGAQRQNR